MKIQYRIDNTRLFCIALNNRRNKYRSKKIKTTTTTTTRAMVFFVCAERSFPVRNFFLCQLKLRVGHRRNLIRKVFFYCLSLQIM